MPDHPLNPEIRLIDGDWYADDPHPHFDWMRANAPVYWDEASEVWGVTRHDLLMRMSKDSQHFCNRYGMRPDSPPIPSMLINVWNEVLSAVMVTSFICRPSAVPPRSL